MSYNNYVDADAAHRAAYDFAEPAVAVVKHPKIVERVARTVEEKNSHLQSYAKVKKFTVLAIDFTQDGGELTPTLKVKRRVVAEKYRVELEELYR